MKKLLNFSILGIVLLLLVSTGERTFWVKASSGYPAMLIEQAPAGADDLQSLRAICGEPLDFKKFGEANAIVRCGRWWPARSVWVVPRGYLRPLDNLL